MSARRPNIASALERAAYRAAETLDESPEKLAFRTLLASATQEDKDEALRSVCGGGYLDVAQMLVENGANPADFDGDRRGSEFAFLIAASGGHIDIIRFLLDNNNYVPEDMTKQEVLRLALDAARDMRTSSGYYNAAINKLSEEFTKVDTAASQLRNIQGLRMLGKKFNENGAIPVPEDVETILGSFLTGKKGTLKQQRNGLAVNLGGMPSLPQPPAPSHPLALTNAEEAEGVVGRKEFSAALNAQNNKSKPSGGRRTKRRRSATRRTRRGSKQSRRRSTRH